MATGASSSSSLSPPAQLRPRGSSLTTNSRSSSSLGSSTSPLTVHPISFSQLSSPTDLSDSQQHHNHTFLNEPQTPSSVIRKSSAPTTIVQDVVGPPVRQSRTGSMVSSSASSCSHDDTTRQGHSSSRPAPHSRSSSGHHYHPHRVSPPLSLLGAQGRSVVHAYEYNHLVQEQDANGGPFSLTGGAASMLTGGPHRPMLSVLLSLGVSALPTRPSRPPFSRPRPGGIIPHGHRTRPSRSASASVPPSARSSLDDDDQSPASPYISLFVAPPPPKAVKRIVVSRSQKFTASASFYLPILFLLTLFIATLVPIMLGLISLPLRSFHQASSRPLSPAESSSLNLTSKPLNIPPRTITDVSALATSLRMYATSSERAKIHVLLVLSMTTIWKHAWSIPGSVVLNVIAGTLFTSTSLSPVPGAASQGGFGGGIVTATLLMTLLTTLGSIAASMLSMPLAPLVRTFFPRALDVTRSALEGDSPSSSAEKTGMKSMGKQRVSRDGTPTWVRLVIMRLVGIVPWSGINVACGVCGVSYLDCFVGTFIGTLPWTAVTCQVGDIIQTLSAASAAAASGSGANAQTLGSVLTSPTHIAKLVLLSALSLGPVLYRDKLRNVLSGNSDASEGGAAMQPIMQENGAIPGPHAVGGGVDDEHLLPLSYHHQQKMKDTASLPRRQMSASSATTSATVVPSSSEASSTVGDDDEIAEPDEAADILIQRDDGEGNNTTKRWSLPWTMWGEKNSSSIDSIHEQGRLGAMRG